MTADNGSRGPLESGPVQLHVPWPLNASAAGLIHDLSVPYPPFIHRRREAARRPKPPRCATTWSSPLQTRAQDLNIASLLRNKKPLEDILEGFTTRSVCLQCLWFFRSLGAWHDRGRTYPSWHHATGLYSYDIIWTHDLFFLSHPIQGVKVLAASRRCVSLTLSMLSIWRRQQGCPATTLAPASRSAGLADLTGHVNCLNPLESVARISQVDTCISFRVICVPW